MPSRGIEDGNRDHHRARLRYLSGPDSAIDVQYRRNFEASHGCDGRAAAPAYDDDDDDSDSRSYGYRRFGECRRRHIPSRTESAHSHAPIGVRKDTQATLHKDRPYFRDSYAARITSNRYNLGDSYRPSRFSSTYSVSKVSDSTERSCCSEWLQWCDSDHGQHCQPYMNDPYADAARPKRLIDVAKGNIVAAHPDARYAALSYVWGTSNSLRLTEKNVQILQQPAALSTIPQTIQDAIVICRDDIHVPYLWVDALCIVQDDPQEQAAQIQAMGDIYAQAYVTLVAAGAEHANAGLFTATVAERGINRGLPRSTSAEQGHKELLSTSKWMGRGWTMQELMFSPRAIFFHGNTITWECHCTVWHSDFPPQRHVLCVTRYSDYARGLQHAPWPDIAEYARNLADYSGRNVTYPKDVSTALSGYITRLSRVFTGGFIYGLPEMFFDVALLWQPQNSKLEPREGPFPTWSWMAWMGKIDTLLWRMAMDFLQQYRRTCTLIEHPLFRIGESTTQPFRPINVCHRRYAHLVDGDFDRELANLDRTFLYDWSIKDRDGANYWEHSFDPRTAFRYPIPVLDPDFRPQTNSDFTVLFFRTRHAFLRLKRHWIDADWASIFDSNGRKIGCLRLHHIADAWKLTVLQTHPDGKQGARHELVAISSYRTLPAAMEDLDVWTDWERETSKKKGSYDFVNVLCIERDERGIASRRALGRITLEDWDREAIKEEVEVFLH